MRLESLNDGAACFDRDSGVTHIMDEAASFVLESVIAQPGMDRETLLARLRASYADDPEALADLLDKALELLWRRGLIRSAEAPHAHR